MRISDWSSDVCSSDLINKPRLSINLHQPLIYSQGRRAFIGLRSDLAAVEICVLRVEEPTAAILLYGHAPLSPCVSRYCHQEYFRRSSVHIPYPLKAEPSASHPHGIQPPTNHPHPSPRP